MEHSEKRRRPASPIDPVVIEQARVSAYRIAKIMRSEMSSIVRNGRARPKLRPCEHTGTPMIHIDVTYSMRGETHFVKSAVSIPLGCARQMTIEEQEQAAKRGMMYIQHLMQFGEYHGEDL